MVTGFAGAILPAELSATLPRHTFCSSNDEGVYDFRIGVRKGSAPSYEHGSGYLDVFHSFGIRDNDISPPGDYLEEHWCGHEELPQIFKHVYAYVSAPRYRVRVWRTGGGVRSWGCSFLLTLRFSPKQNGEMWDKWKKSTSSATATVASRAGSAPSCACALSGTDRAASSAHPPPPLLLLRRPATAANCAFAADLVVTRALAECAKAPRLSPPSFEEPDAPPLPHPWSYSTSTIRVLVGGQGIEASVRPAVYAERYRGEPAAHVREGELVTLHEHDRLPDDWVPARREAFAANAAAHNKAHERELADVRHLAALWLASPVTRQ